MKNSFIPDTGYNRHFKWLKQLDLIIPTLEEQIEIVNKLDKVQEIIDIRKNKLKNFYYIAVSLINLKIMLKR